MKHVLLIVAILVTVPAFAQKIGGVEAPNALSVKIIQVSVINVPEHIIREGAVFDVKEHTEGYDVVGETKTARYRLTCSVTTRIEEYSTSALDSLNIRTEIFIDDKPASWETDEGSTGSDIAHKSGLSPGVIDYSCQDFHVGMTVVFYSVDNLIWLSETDARGTVSTAMHGKP